MSHYPLNELARVIRMAAYEGYTNSLVGNPAPIVVESLERYQKPEVGQWAFEATTIYLRSCDLKGVGVLTRMGPEPVVWEGDPEFVWDEAYEGRPHPTEPVYYIQGLDGVETRWTNALILRVPSTLRPRL